MNNSRAFVFNTISGLTMTFVSTISGFIVPKLILGGYGKEITGLVASITQLMSFFMLLEAGLSRAVTANLYGPMAKNDFKTASGILSASKRLYDRISVFFSACVLAAAFIYPFIVQNSDIEYPIIFFLVIILGVSGILEFVSIRRYSVLLNADNRFGVVQIVHAIRLFLQCGLISALVYFRLPILIVEAASIIVWVICPVLLYFYCHNRYSQVDYTVPPNMEALSNRHDAMVQPLTLVMQTSAPIMLATILLPISEVGIISMYLIVVRGVDNILGTLNSTTAAFGRLYAKGETERMYRAYSQFESLCCVISTVVFSVMTVNYEPFMALYSGYTIAGLAFLSCIRGFLRNLRMPQENMLNAIGWFRGTRRYMLTQTAIQIVASVLLGLKYGVLGIFAGDIISQLYRDIEIVIHIPQKIGIPVWPSVKRWLLSFGAFALICPVLGQIKSFFPAIDVFILWIIFSIVLVLAAVFIAGSLFLLFDRQVYIHLYKTKLVPFFKTVAARFS